MNEEFCTRQSNAVVLEQNTQFITWLFSKINFCASHYHTLRKNVTEFHVWHGLSHRLSIFILLFLWNVHHFRQNSFNYYIFKDSAVISFLEKGSLFVRHMIEMQCMDCFLRIKTVERDHRVTLARWHGGAVMFKLIWVLFLRTD